MAHSLRSDRALLGAISDWISYAPAILQEIATYRNSDGYERAEAVCHLRSAEPGLVEWFYGVTRSIVAAIELHHRGMPSHHLIDIASAIECWYRDGGAGRIAPQDELATAYNRAAVAVNALNTSTNERIRLAQARCEPDRVDPPAASAHDHQPAIPPVQPARQQPPKIAEPSPLDRRAWMLYEHEGIGTQARVAEILQAEYPDRVITQGWVSRACDRVRRYTEAVHRAGGLAKP